jgi:hypothetical protein
MPIKGDAAKVLKSMEKTYKDPKKAKQVLYATANKQDRKPETWKKEGGVADYMPSGQQKTDMKQLGAIGAGTGLATALLAHLLASSEDNEGLLHRVMRHTAVGGAIGAGVGYNKDKLTSPAVVDNTIGKTAADVKVEGPAGKKPAPIAKQTKLVPPASTLKDVMDRYNPMKRM